MTETQSSNNAKVKYIYFHIVTQIKHIMEGDNQNLYQILQGPFGCIPPSYLQRPPHLHLIRHYRQSASHSIQVHTSVRGGRAANESTTENISSCDLLTLGIRYLLTSELHVGHNDLLTNASECILVLK